MDEGNAHMYNNTGTTDTRQMHMLIEEATHVQPDMHQDVD